MRIGIDIGGSHIASGIVLEDGMLMDKETRDIDISSICSEERVEQLIIDEINYEISTLIKRNNYSIGDISKIGIAAPGNPSENCIRNLVNLHIKEFNIVNELIKIYNTKVVLHNDGKCAGFAEKKYGALNRYDDCIFLCIGTGVGSAVFIDNELLVPKNAVGFELGHMIIDKSSENKCNCGNNGCFETFASMKRFKQNAIKTLNLESDCISEEVQNYIRNNIEKPAVKKYVEEYIENIAIGLSNIINIFEPEAIAFGGSFSYYSDIFLPMIKERIKKYRFNKSNKIELLEAKLKNDAGIIGSVII